MARWFRQAIVVMAVVAVAFSTEFASQLRKCRVDNSTTLNTCLKQTLEDLRPHLKTGIAELSLPTLEPMRLNSIVFRQGDGGVVVQSMFTDVIVSGLSNFTTRFVDADPVARVLTVSLNIPSLRVTGKYDLSGNILFLPVRGNGDFWANFKGVDASGTSQVSVKTGPDGVERLSVHNTNIDFTISDIRIRLDNLFNGDPILGETVNHFLNENAGEILQELKPEVVKRLNELVQKVMNDALSQLPVSAFLIRPTSR